MILGPHHIEEWKMELERILRETIKPELNRIYTEPPPPDYGDMGFFCKEHAFHCMFLCRLLGRDAVIKRGDLSFWLKPEGILFSSYRSAANLDHAWCRVDGVAPVDLSVNFEYYPHGRPNLDLVFGAVQRGRYAIAYTDSQTEYEKQIIDDSALPRICYLESTEVEIAAGELPDDPYRFLIKPPSGGLVKGFGDHIFSAITMHLLDLAHGKTKRLTTYKDFKATLRTISTRYPSATADIKSALGIS